MQPSPAPAEPSRSPGVDSGRTTLSDAAADMAKAEKDLSEALDSSRAIPLTTDRCAIVCKALASMRVAAGHLCELTADDRCDDAKTRLARAESRAREACPVCTGG